MSDFYLPSWVSTPSIPIIDWEDCNSWLANNSRNHHHYYPLTTTEMRFDPFYFQPIDNSSLEILTASSPSDSAESWPFEEEDSEKTNLNENDGKTNINNKSHHHITMNMATDRPYSCSFCQRSFGRRHDLERHTRVHTGIKPYKCPACNKCFARSDARRRHWKSEVQCNTHHVIAALLKKRGRRSD